MEKLNRDLEKLLVSFLDNKSKAKYDRTSKQTKGYLEETKEYKEREAQKRKTSDMIYNREEKFRKLNSPWYVGEKERREDRRYLQKERRKNYEFLNKNYNVSPEEFRQMEIELKERRKREQPNKISRLLKMFKK